MARGKRPATFRTRKLSLSAPMVLPWRRGGRVGRRRTTIPEGAPATGWGPFVMPGPAFCTESRAREQGRHRQGDHHADAEGRQRAAEFQRHHRERRETRRQPHLPQDGLMGTFLISGEMRNVPISQSEYLRALPRAFSTGYFCALSAILSRAAASRSTPSLSASRTR